MNEINKFYNIVFDKNGNINNCGRKACQQLIELCEQYYNIKYHKKEDFGNTKTGFMNIKNIKQFVDNNLKELNK